MFVLSTFGDGPYWTSCLEPLLYPSGCSFYRPFSYRTKYVPSTFLDVLKGSNFLSDKEQNQGIFGIRFGHEKDSECLANFIPLRKIEITRVFVSDTVQIRFKLGEYVSPSSSGMLEVVKLGNDIISKDEPILLFPLPLNDVASLKYQPDFPNGLLDSLGSDPAISSTAKKHFIGTATLRLVRFGERGKTRDLISEEIENTEKRRIYGFKLEASKTYDLDLSYSRIMGNNEPQAPVTCNYKFNEPSEDFALGRTIFSISGNYREDTIWLKPKAGVPAPIYLEWVGVKKNDNDVQADAKEDKIIPLGIPVIISEKKWSSERKIYLVICILTLLLGSYFGVQAYRKAADYSPISISQQGNQATTPRPATPSPSPLIPVFTALASFCFATFASYIKDVVKPKRD